MRMRHAPLRDTERSPLPSITRRLRSAVSRLPWYGLSVGLSALALALMVLMRPLMEHSVFFLFLAAVAISALYGGLGPGLVATALSTVACDFFFLPANGVPLSGPEEALRLTIFLSTGVIVSWLAEGPKRAEDRLRERNRDLERWAAERKVLEERLVYRATHDYLTDLHNQASFYEHLSRASEAARRRGSKLAERFQERLRVPFRIDGRHRMYTSASTAVGAPERPQELLRAADLTAYRAKRTGKARSVVFDPEATKGAAPF